MNAWQASQESALQQGVYVLVDGDMRCGFPAHHKSFSAYVRKMKEAADVVILVKSAEDAFGSALREPKIGQWRKKGIAAGDRQIFLDNLLQCHGLNDPKGNILSFRGTLRAEESLCFSVLRPGEIPHFVRNDNQEQFIRNVMASDPDVRARFSVGRVDVKQIRLLHLPQGIAQFRGSVLGAEKGPGRTLDPLRLVEAGNFPPRNPQPGCRPAAIAALALQLFQARQDRRGDFGPQAGSGEIIPDRKSVV